MTACLLKNEPVSLLTLLVKGLRAEGRGKPSLNRALSDYRLLTTVYGASRSLQSVVCSLDPQRQQDPKPGELAMGRVKFE